MVTSTHSTITLSLSTPRPPPGPTLFPYTTLFRSRTVGPYDPTRGVQNGHGIGDALEDPNVDEPLRHRRSDPRGHRSEEHTSELQSHHDLVCRLLLEKKKKKKK